MSKWPEVSLGEVVQVARTKIGPEDIADGTTYVGLENIEQGGEISGYKSVRQGQIKSTKSVFSRDHVLYGKLRPYLAKIALPDRGGICSTDILPLVPDPRIDRTFLAYFLRQEHMVQHASNLAVGVNLPRLSPKALIDFTIPLPPLDEQRRIAAILDKADELRTKRREAIAKLDTLAQSIFIDMFGDPVTNPKGWLKRPVSSYVDKFETGKSIAGEPGSKVMIRNRVLKTSAVTDMIYKPEENKSVPDDHVPQEHHFVRKGDLLFSRANTTELVGAVAYVHSTPPNLLLPDRLWRFVWSEPNQVLPLFVSYMLQTPSMRREVSRLASGTSGSMQNISQRKLMGMSTILPEFRLQREFVEKVSRLPRVSNRFSVALSEAEKIFSSIQQRAFRGDL